MTYIEDAAKLHVRGHGDYCESHCSTVEDYNGMNMRVLQDWPCDAAMLLTLAKSLALALEAVDPTHAIFAEPEVQALLKLEGAQS